MNVVTAEEARKKTMYAIKKISDKQMSKVMEQINNTIDHGSFKFTREGELYIDVINKLESLGYKVYHEVFDNDGYPDTYHTVEW